MTNAQWIWKGWLAAGVLNGLASDPGKGKTILTADLACRLWFGLTLPDGQPNPRPAGTRSLWVPGDRHYTQLIGLADKFGLPDEAILFNAPATDPTAGLDMDDPADGTPSPPGMIRSATRSVPSASDRPASRKARSGGP